MITRPSRGGYFTAIPTVEDPDVVVWAHTEQDAEYLAAKEHIPLAIQQEEARVRMERDFARQAIAEFRKIRARA